MACVRAAGRFQLAHELSVSPFPRLMRLVFFAGGAAALAWQVLWSHHLGLALGASARGVALTVATAMLGMTIGALTCGRFLHRTRPTYPVKLYGLLELGIGLSAIIPGVTEKWIMSVDASVHGKIPWMATPFTLLSLALSIGPACFFMGATIPVMGLVARSLAAPLSRLYGWNTAGAAAGALFVSFALIPSLGLRGSALTLCFLHLVLALICGLIARRRDSRNVLPEENSLHDLPDEDSPPATMPGWHGMVLVLITGISTFVLEVVWFRALRSAWFSTSDSIAIMLFCFLIALAAGAAVAPSVRRLGVPLWLVMGMASLLVILSSAMIGRFDLIDAFQKGGAARQIYRLLAGLAVMGPPVALVGVILPTLLDAAKDPRGWAVLYGINTFGAVMGANLAAWILLEALGPDMTAWFVGGLLVAGACLLCRSWRLRGTLVALFFTLIAGVFPFHQREKNRAPGAERSVAGEVEMIELKHGPDATISVVGFEQGKALLINGFVATAQLSNARANYMDAMGRLPMLLHPDPRNALVICFGTGQTAHAVRDELPERLDLVDLNAAVFDMAHHFEANHDVLRDPRVRKIVMDGRAWLRRTEARYDVVTLEPMPPFFSGSNSLYSADFYRLVHSRLNPGGLLAQWFPLHLMSPDQAIAIAATFAEVFPESILWMDPGSGDRSGLPQQGILIGQRPVEGGAVAGEFWQQWPGFLRPSGMGSRPITAEDARRNLILSPAQLNYFAKGGKLITDDNQYLEYSVSVYRDKDLRVGDTVRQIHVRLQSPPSR